jgi:antitoxin VapB
MAIHVTNPVVEAKLRELAERHGIGVTAAIDLAVEAARKADEAEIQRRRTAIKAIQDEIASWPKTGLKADKAFYDSLNDE